MSTLKLDRIPPTKKALSDNHLHVPKDIPSLQSAIEFHTDESIHSARVEEYIKHRSSKDECYSLYVAFLLCLTYAVSIQ